MDPVQVLREMVDPHLFSAEEKIKIKGNGLTREEQWENLLEILPRKGAKAYKTFQKIIAEIHPHLETTILKAEIRELKSELKTERERSAGLQRRLSPVKRGQPTNDELEKLGTDIAGGWKILGRRLDFACATIEEIDHNYPNLPEKGFQMLLRWTQREGSAATYQALCDALQHELVKRQDLAEKFCYANEKEFEVLQTDLDHARAQSDRMRQIFHDMTTGLGQKLETLEENVKSMHELLKEKADSKAIETRLQKIETPVKQSKDIQKSMKNSVKDDEEEEIKLGKQRDQIGDRKLMKEERRKSFETSSESNNNSVLLETSSSENELAADITPDALEHDDFHVGLDRQKNGRFLDRATSPIQSESEC